MELLIPTLNKFISYQFLLVLLEGANHEQSSQNNYSTCGTLPPEVWEFFFFFLEKTFHSNSEQGWLSYLFSWGNLDIEL